MIPSVEQQLRAVRRTLAETVLPAIDPTDRFAAEQAGLIVATLDRVLDVQASEYRYDLVAWRDATALDAALAGLEARSGSATSADASGTAGSGQDGGAAAAPADLDALRAATTAAAESAERRFRALLGTDHADAARAVTGRAARRATERELAAARMTGFPRSVGSIAEVLDRQEAEPFDAVSAATPAPASAEAAR